jgi:hypothetical protein
MNEDGLKQIFKMKCSLGDANEIRKVISDNPSIEFNFTQGLLIGCVEGKLETVKCFLETPELREKVNLYVPYETGTPQYVPDGALLHSHFNNQGHIVSYLLYNIKFEVSRDTMNYLKFHQIDNLINKIEKRDLFFKMDAEMNIPKEDDKKVNKPKI